MRTAIRRCGPCGLYTLKDACPKCGAATIMPLPPRYSPEDRYGKYRRQLKALSEAGK
jgi:H/ACA ribonucleoprotein complex subunit 3